MCGSALPLLRTAWAGPWVHGSQAQAAANNVTAFYFLFFLHFEGGPVRWGRWMLSRCAVAPRMLWAPDLVDMEPSPPALWWVPWNGGVYCSQSLAALSEGHFSPPPYPSLAPVHSTLTHAGFWGACVFCGV